MEIIRSIQEMRMFSQTIHTQGKTIGFVPTMGALHSGHISLINLAQQRADVTGISIFVNPTQFGPQEDFSKYPRPFSADCEKARDAGAAFVFAPTPEDLYPKAYRTYVTVDNLSDRLCGASRKGHFRGVATVVLKLFNIVMPHVAVFGQKDAQQVIVLKRMVDDLNVPVEMITAPTLREADGLAMSSRNIYLTVSERTQAAAISVGLKTATLLYEQGERSAKKLTATVHAMYNQHDLLSIEYIELVDTQVLEPVGTIIAESLLAVACRTQESQTRLIDNIILPGVAS